MTVSKYVNDSKHFIRRGDTGPVIIHTYDSCYNCTGMKHTLTVSDPKRCKKCGGKASLHRPTVECPFFDTMGDESKCPYCEWPKFCIDIESSAANSDAWCNKVIAKSLKKDN